MYFPFTIDLCMQLFEYVFIYVYIYIYVYDYSKLCLCTYQSQCLNLHTNIKYQYRDDYQCTTIYVCKYISKKLALYVYKYL